MILLSATFSSIFWSFAPICIPLMFVLILIGIFVLSEMNCNGGLDNMGPSDIPRLIFCVIVPIAVFLVLFFWFVITAHCQQNLI